MQTLEMDHAAYKAEAFPGRYLVRSFHGWNAWAAVYQAQPVLLLDEYVRERVTVCFYTTETERKADIIVLRTIPDDPPASPAPSGSGGGTPPAPVSAALHLPLPPLSKRQN